jgi:hypothetical protein
MDEASLHPFTVARMTDHNVRGPDSQGGPVAEDHQTLWEDARGAGRAA